MPVQANITLDSRVYAPRGNINGVATWVLSTDPDFGNGMSTLSETVRGPSKEGILRIRFRLEVPKLATSGSTCQCEGEQLGFASAVVEVLVPRSFTPAERVNLRERLQGLVASAVVSAAIDNLEGSW